VCDFVAVDCNVLLVLAAGALVVLVFAGGVAIVMFLALGHYKLLRVDQVSELAGIDNIDHNGPAYPEVMSATASQTGLMMRSTCLSPLTGQTSASVGRRSLL